METVSNIINIWSFGGVVLSTFFSVLLLIASVSVIISVLMQESSGEGMGTIGGNAPESQWGSNRGANRSILLKRITVVSAAIFMISALVLTAI